MSSSFDTKFEDWGIINASDGRIYCTRSADGVKDRMTDTLLSSSYAHTLAVPAACPSARMLPRVYYPPLQNNLYEKRAASITAQLFDSREFGIGQRSGNIPADLAHC